MDQPHSSSSPSTSSSPVPAPEADSSSVRLSVLDIASQHAAERHKVDQQMSSATASSSSSSSSSTSDAAASPDAPASAAAPMDTSAPPPKEFFRLKLDGFPRSTKFNELETVVSGLHLNHCFLKKVHDRYAFVAFNSAEDRDKAIAVLNGIRIRQTTMAATVAKNWIDEESFQKQNSGVQRGKRRAEEPERKESAEKKIRESSLESILERLNDNVTSYWRMPYEEQLQSKEAAMRKVLATYSKRMDEQFGSNPAWSMNGNELFCQMDSIRGSPLIRDYRNKCEFGVGRGYDGSLKMVGFSLGAYKDGIVSLAPPYECVNLSQSTKKIAAAFQSFIQNHSTMSGYDRITHVGFWRQLVVRESTLGEYLAIVHISTTGVDRNVVASEVESLKQHFLKLREEGFHLQSLLYQEYHNEQSYSNEPVHTLFGNPYIHETLLGLRFRVSHSAFFQINVPAAEVLFSLVRDWTHVSDETVLVDICCGTGIIGQLMAKQSKRVIGIEMVPEAIEDAKVNASLNALDNTEYICSRAEDAMANVIEKLPPGDVVGIVDPPRNGLHPKVVRAIRNCTRINRLIYVSCNPAAASENWIQFTQPSNAKFTGKPYRIVHVAPVDLFPQTEHTELVLLMER